MESLRKEVKEISEVQEKELHLEKEIVEELKHLSFELYPQRTYKTRVVFGGSNMATNALVLNVGQSSIATIEPLLADGLTNSGGVVSGQTFTISDPSLTLVANADGTATITGVAASTGAVSGTASSTVTDTDGAVSTWIQPFTVTVNAVIVPPQQITQSTGVTFSTPITAGAAVPSVKTGILPLPPQ